MLDERFYNPHITPVWRNPSLRQTLLMSCHFQQTNFSGVTVTSPLAVDFRSFVARQSPHVVHRQAGRLVGLQRQWGEPVQGQKREEASVINWVLVPEIEKKKKDMEMGEMSKSAGSHRGATSGEQAPVARRGPGGAFAQQSRWKVNHARGVWTVICTVFTKI